MTLSTFPHFSILLLWQFAVRPFLHTCIYSTYLFCPFYYRNKNEVSQWFCPIDNRTKVLFIIYSVTQLNGFCPFFCRSFSYSRNVRCRRSFSSAPTNEPPSNKRTQLFPWARSVRKWNWRWWTTIMKIVGNHNSENCLWERKRIIWLNNPGD